MPINIKKLLKGKKSRPLILFATMTILGLALYRSSLHNLTISVLHREGSSHGLLVPFITIYLLWRKSNKIKQLQPVFEPLAGSAIILISLIIAYIARDNFENTINVLSFFIMLNGMVITLWGKKIYKEMCFPLLFMLTMIPLPEPVYAEIAEWMRSVTTNGSTWLTQLAGVPIVRKDYYIQLPNTNLYVGKSCSGIRYLISYFVFGLVYAYLYRKTFLSSILVIIFTIPLAIGAGILRLATIFLSAHYIGAFMAGPQIHILLSWIVFAVISFGIISVDRKIASRHTQTGI